MYFYHARSCSVPCRLSVAVIISKVPLYLRLLGYVELEEKVRHRKVVLVYQKARTGDEPTITRMLLSSNYKRIAYRNFTELTTVIGFYERYSLRYQSKLA